MLELKCAKSAIRLAWSCPRRRWPAFAPPRVTVSFLVEAPDGTYRLTPYDPEFERQMEIAEKGMAQYRNALRTLAK